MRKKKKTDKELERAWRRWKKNEKKHTMDVSIPHSMDKLGYYD